MADETHQLQKEPAEGSRRVIEHELERQSGQAESGKGDGQDRRGARNKDDAARPNGSR